MIPVFLSTVSNNYFNYINASKISEIQPQNLENSCRPIRYFKCCSLNLLGRN